jgi:hypothetical protein
MSLYDIKSLLWTDFDNNGDRRKLDALNLLYHDLRTRIPDSTNDPDLRNARIHGIIGGAECLYLEGKSSEAAVLIGRIEPSILSLKQRGVYSRACAVIFSQDGRYGDAINYLKPLAGAEVGTKDTYYLGLLFTAAIGAHRSDLAKYALDEIRQGGPLSSFADAEMTAEITSITNAENNTK